MFGIVRNLAVPALLGTSLTVKCIKGIYGTVRNVVPFNSPSVPVLVVLDATSVQTSEQPTGIGCSICVLQEQERNLVRVECTVAFQPIDKTPILVASTARGFVQVDAFALFEKNYP